MYNSTIYNRRNQQDTYGNKPYDVIKNVTAENVLETAHLNWNVDKLPVFIEDGKGGFGQYTDKFSTVRINRDGTRIPLGVVGKQYKVFQNENLLDLVTPFFDIEDVNFETAGYFGEGEKVFMLFKLPEFITVNGDETEQMLFIGNSHDGTTSITIGMTSVRVVCGNTFRQAMGQKTNIRIRHCESSQEKVQQAHEIIGLANVVTKQINDIFNNMSKTKVNDKIIDNVVRKLIEVKPTDRLQDISTRKQNQIISMKDFIDLEFKNNALNGNAYGLFNGITAYYNHGASRNSSNRFEKIMSGTNDSKMQEAYNMLSNDIKVWY